MQRNSPRKVVFFTGAGISTGSGIPTFRGLYGLYNWPYIWFFSLCSLSILAAFLNFSFSLAFFIIAVGGSLAIVAGIGLVLTSIGWSMFNPLAWIVFKVCFYDQILSKKPSKSHRIIEQYAEGRDNVTILTTNVDGLEGEHDNVHRLHGYFREFICARCGKVHKIKNKQKLPWRPIKCPKCRQPMRTKCSLFGDEKIPNKYINWTLFESCPVTKLKEDDVFIIIGSSAEYSNNYFEMAFNSGCTVIEINTQAESSFINQGQIYVRGKSDDVLQRVIKIL